jgi:hypothetical protein
MRGAVSMPPGLRVCVCSDIGWTMPVDAAAAADVPCAFLGCLPVLRRLKADAPGSHGAPSRELKIAA